MQEAGDIWSAESGGTDVTHRVKKYIAKCVAILIPRMLVFMSQYRYAEHSKCLS